MSINFLSPAINEIEREFSRFGAVEVIRLRLNDLHLRVLSGLIGKTLCPIRRDECAAQFDDVGLAVRRFGEPLGEALVLFDEIGLEHGHEILARRARRFAVNENDGNVGALLRLQSLFKADLFARQSQRCATDCPSPSAKSRQLSCRRFTRL
ncbi:MAG: hypothetical protein M3Q76_07890 [Acidobacteriota bacterium]|nr:hypothetical protein [Acidobacteriota bacterium]